MGALAFLADTGCFVLDVRSYPIKTGIMMDAFYLRCLLWLMIVAGALFIGGGEVWAQDNELGLATPGNPKPDLATDHLKAVSYARGLELMLDEVEKIHPSLASDAYSARCLWAFSPFSRGAASIQKEIETAGKGHGKAMLEKLDEQTLAVVRPLGGVSTKESAVEFLKLVARRAMGAMELADVRANLLWRCPSYVERPEEEIRDGYVVRQVKEAEGLRVNMAWPMSWKEKTSRVSEVVTRQVSHGGHGRLSAALSVKRLPVPPGEKYAEHELIEGFTQADLEQDGDDSGVRMQVLSFTKTRVNGRPTAWVTQSSEHEQMGLKVKVLYHALYLTHHDRMITLQFMIMAAPDADALPLLKKHEPMFRAIAESLWIESADGTPSLTQAPSPKAAGGGLLSGRVLPDLTANRMDALNSVQRVDLVMVDILKRHPDMALQVLAARSAWRSSGYGIGAEALRKQLQAMKGETGAEMLALVEECAKAKVVELRDLLMDKAGGESFLKMVDEFAKTQTKPDKASATLLANHPWYQKRPEEEVLHGYVTKQRSQNDGLEHLIEVPLSWTKVQDHPGTALQVWRSGGGHGKISATLQILHIPLRPGKMLGENDLHDDFTEESMRQMQAETDEGMVLLSFQKTKVNTRPAILTTSRKALEQLGRRYMLLTHSLYLGHYDKMVIFSLESPTDDEAEVTAELRRLEPLFRTVASSVRYQPPGQPRDPAMGPVPGAPLPAAGRSSVRQPSASVSPPATTLNDWATATPTESYEVVTNREFGFRASLPKGVITNMTENAHRKGVMLVSLDRERALMLEVNAVHIVSSGVVRPTAGLLMDDFHEGLAVKSGVEPNSIKVSPLKWRGCPALRYSYTRMDASVTSMPMYHCGVTLVKGEFIHHLEVCGPKSADAESGLMQLSESFELLKD